LVRRRFPDIDHPGQLVARGQVLVDGAPVCNLNAFVRADAAIKVLRRKPLRGTVKLAHALGAFGLDVTGRVAVDVGAVDGGFTQALLDAGAERVYSVAAGVGQLRGWLRAHPSVVNLERTNLARLDRHLVPEPVDPR
jgi:23S rRNA (cytidine1920-2'-O)/16S rRNA (cytidine1409-2'-O)-methyltransferase